MNGSSSIFDVILFPINRRFAADLQEEFELDDIQEVTDTMREDVMRVPYEPDESGRRALVQSELFSVFDSEASRNRSRIRADRYKENERVEIDRRNMVNMRAPGLAVAIATSSISPTRSNSNHFDGEYGGNTRRSRFSSALVEELMAMGFDEELCKKSLTRTKNNKALAIEYLLSRSANTEDKFKVNEGTYALPEGSNSTMIDNCTFCGFAGEESGNSEEAEPSNIIGVASYRKSVAFNI